MSSKSSQLEAKRMAIINLTSDYPFEYTAWQLSKWVKMAYKTTLNLCNILNLDVRERTPGKHEKPISGMRMYLKYVF